MWIEQQSVTSFSSGDVKHLCYMELRKILRSRPRLFFNLRVFMLEQSWGLKRFLIFAYTWLSFGIGFVRRNVSFHVLVNLAIEKRKQMITSVIIYCTWSTAFLLMMQVLGETSLYTMGRATLRSATSHWLQRESRQLPKGVGSYLAKKSWAEEGHWAAKDFFPAIELWSCSLQPLVLPLAVGVGIHDTKSVMRVCCGWEKEKGPFHLAPSARLAACTEVQGCNGKSHPQPPTSQKAGKNAGYGEIACQAQSGYPGRNQ